MPRQEVRFPPAPEGAFARALTALAGAIGGVSARLPSELREDDTLAVDTPPHERRLLELLLAAQDPLLSIEDNTRIARNALLALAPVPLAALAPATASVTTSSTKVVDGNPRRRALMIANLTNATVSFGIGQTAILSSGITLTQNGVWEMDAQSLSAAAIYAIGSASATLSIQEFE